MRQPLAPAPVSATARRSRRLSFGFGRRFFLVMLLGMLILGSWVAQKIETAVLDHAGATAAAYVDSVISAHLQPLGQAAWLGETQIGELDELLGDTLAAENVVAFKVWSPDGTILFSPNHDLIGRRFPVDAGLAMAVSGEVSTDISDLDEPENVAEREAPKVSF